MKIVNEILESKSTITFNKAPDKTIFASSFQRHFCFRFISFLSFPRFFLIIEVGKLELLRVCL